MTSSPHPAAAKIMDQIMDLQGMPTNAEQIVLVDEMLDLITAGKTTGMDKQEEYTMTKALQLYRGYLTGKETTKVPIKIKDKSNAKGVSKKRNKQGMDQKKKTQNMKKREKIL